MENSRRDSSLFWLHILFASLVTHYNNRVLLIVCNISEYHYGKISARKTKYIISMSVWDTWWYVKREYFKTQSGHFSVHQMDGLTEKCSWVITRFISPIIHLGAIRANDNPTADYHSWAWSDNDQRKKHPPGIGPFRARYGSKDFPLRSLVEGFIFLGLFLVNLTAT